MCPADVADGLGGGAGGPIPGANGALAVVGVGVKGSRCVDLNEVDREAEPRWKFDMPYEPLPVRRLPNRSSPNL